MKRWLMNAASAAVAWVGSSPWDAGLNTVEQLLIRELSHR
jgi:hypothetical protein